MAEWLGRALQKLLQRFESARDLDTKPLHESEEAFLLRDRKTSATMWLIIKRACVWSLLQKTDEINNQMSEANKLVKIGEEQKSTTQIFDLC